MDNPEDYCVHCGQYGNPCACPTPSERLRKIRNAIGQIQVRTNDGYRVRAEALTLLFNAEHEINSARERAARVTQGQPIMRQMTGFVQPQQDGSDAPA